MILIISYCFIVLHTYCIEYCNYFEIFIVKDKIVNFVCSKFIKGNNWYALSALQPAHASSKPFVYVVFMKSRETQITMVKWTNAGGQTKRAKERSFVYRHQHGGDDVTWKARRARSIRDLTKLGRVSIKWERGSGSVYFCSKECCFRVRAGG